jgi:hypothetical protein
MNVADLPGLLFLEGFSRHDALVVAAALESGCSTLPGEDLQHGRNVRGVASANPFADLLTGWAVAYLRPAGLPPAHQPVGRRRTTPELAGEPAYRVHPRSSLQYYPPRLHLPASSIQLPS